MGGVPTVVLTNELRGEATEHPLADNAYEYNGYRFHDVLHFVFAACLGWSPVLRKVLRRREQIVNRTQPVMGDLEDGGRA